MINLLSDNNNDLNWNGMSYQGREAVYELGEVIRYSKVPEMQPTGAVQ